MGSIPFLARWPEILSNFYCEKRKTKRSFHVDWAHFLLDIFACHQVQLPWSFWRFVTKGMYKISAYTWYIYICDIYIERQLDILCTTCISSRKNKTIQLWGFGGHPWHDSIPIPPVFFVTEITASEWLLGIVLRCFAFQLQSWKQVCIYIYIYIIEIWSYLNSSSVKIRETKQWSKWQTAIPEFGLIEKHVKIVNGSLTIFFHWCSVNFNQIHYRKSHKPILPISSLAELDRHHNTNANCFRPLTNCRLPWRILGLVWFGIEIFNIAQGRMMWWEVVMLKQHARNLWVMAWFASFL